MFKNPKGPFAPGGVPRPWPKDYTIISPEHDSPGFGKHRDATGWELDKNGWNKVGKEHIDNKGNPIRPK